MKYIREVESVFEIIAEPNRRAILSLLVSSQQSVGDIERQLRMPQESRIPESRYPLMVVVGGMVDAVVSFESEADDGHADEV